MVRKRGTYQIKIRDKQLICLFCKHDQFQHREVYMDLTPLGETVTDQLTLQSFCCTSCGDIRMFEEKNPFEYSEVEKE